MKKLKAYIVVAIMLIFVTGCSLKSFDADTNTVYVKKDGTVMEAIIEDFGESYYDSTELESLINDSINEYNNGTENVKNEKFKVKDQTAKLIMSYKSAEDYAKFNEEDFFAGTISDAIKAGYDFGQEFTNLEEKIDISSETIQSLTQYKVVIFEDKAEIRADSKIAYISNNAELVNEKTAKLKDEAAGPAYIVYE
jgi:hypothetical protein